jgi:hypothetical protein
MLFAIVLVLAVILIGAAVLEQRPKRSCTNGSAVQATEGFMTYPYLDLWDTYDAGDRGTFYGLMEDRSEDKRPGPSYRMRPPAFRGRVAS